MLAQAKKYPESREAQLLLADAAAHAGQQDVAVATLRVLAGRDPSDREASALLGSALEQAHQISEAKVEYRRCLKMDPKNATVLNNLAFLMGQTNENPKEAEKLIHEALTIAPGNPQFLDTSASLHRGPQTKTP